VSSQGESYLEADDNDKALAHEHKPARTELLQQFRHGLSSLRTACPCVCSWHCPNLVFRPRQIGSVESGKYAVSRATNSSTDPALPTAKKFLSNTAAQWKNSSGMTRKRGGYARSRLDLLSRASSWRQERRRFRRGLTRGGPAVVVRDRHLTSATTHLVLPLRPTSLHLHDAMLKTSSSPTLKMPTSSFGARYICPDNGLSTVSWIPPLRSS